MLRDFFRNLSMRGERYYFTRGKIEKLKFPFWVEGTFGDDIWWGGVGDGAGGPVEGGVSGSRRGNGREPDGAVGARRDR